MSKSKIAFPFLGAGDAEYFEYCTILVRFFKVPDKVTRKEIMEKAPLPLSVRDNDFFNSILVASTSRYVNKGIQKYFGKKNDKIPRGEKSIYCTEDASDAFEKAILNWLKEIHQISPIEVVLRHEDYEAGGTSLSVLHYDSVSKIPELLKRWHVASVNDFGEEESVYMESLVSGVLHYSKDKTSTLYNSIQEKFLPFQYILFLLKTKKIKKLGTLLKDTTVSDAYFERLSDGLIEYLQSDEYDDEMVVSATRCMIKDERFLKQFLYRNTFSNHVILIAAFMKQEREIVIKIHELISTIPDDDLTRFIQPIYVHVLTKTIASETFEIAIALFEFIVDLLKARDIKYYDKSFYNNALWIIQTFNTGLPVNRELNRKFLEVCTPRGYDNPPVFHGAACVHLEMNELDLAFDCIKRAIAAGINGKEYDLMMEDIRSSKLFEGLSQRPDVNEFVRVLNK